MLEYKKFYQIPVVVKAPGEYKTEKNKAGNVELQNLLAKLRTGIGGMLGIRELKNGLKI